MRILLLLAILLPALVRAEDSAEPTLRYPDNLLPVIPGAPADVWVEMSGDAAGRVLSARIAESSRPQQDAAVLAALQVWRFRPAFEQGRAVSWQRRQGFVFAAPPSPSQTPARLRQELTIYYPQGEHWTGADPEVLLEIVLDAEGDVRSLRAATARSPALEQVAVQALLSPGRKFVPAFRDGQPVPSLLRLPLVFTTLPQLRKPIVPEYPPELLARAIEGSVLARFTVDETGAVRDIRIPRASHARFEQAVVEALPQWRFAPAQRRGQPVSVTLSQPFPFALRQQEIFSLDATQRVLAAATEPYAIGADAPAPGNLPEAFAYDTPPAVELATAVVYPYELLKAGANGSAKIGFLIDPQGRITEATVLAATQPAFGLAAKAAMESWRFKPARKDGKPSWAMLQREFSFSRNDRDTAPDAAALRLLKRGAEEIPGLAELDAIPAGLYQPPPVYPRDRESAGIGDTVSVEFYIDREGRAQLPRALSYRDEALAWAALTAVSRWRFEVPRRGGKAVDARARVPVVFAPAE